MRSPAPAGPPRMRAQGRRARAAYALLGIQQRVRGGPVAAYAHARGHGRGARGFWTVRTRCASAFRMQQRAGLYAGGARRVTHVKARLSCARGEQADCTPQREGARGHACSHAAGRRAACGEWPAHGCSPLQFVHAACRWPDRACCVLRCCARRVRARSALASAMRS